ncbi:MAG: hypothetical protein AAGC78_10325 [Cellvibrio sp.]
MKFNWKNKKLIAGVFTVVFLWVGVANPELAGQAGASLTCAVVVCDAA